MGHSLSATRQAIGRASASEGTWYIYTDQPGYTQKLEHQHQALKAEHEALAHICDMSSKLSGLKLKPRVEGQGYTCIFQKGNAGRDTGWYLWFVLENRHIDLDW